jgi:hypothetical protein
MFTAFKAAFVAGVLAAGLSGCQSVLDQGAIYQNAQGTVVRMYVDLGEYESKTIPHALGGFGPTFNETALTYRWVHVRNTSNKDRDTNMHTVALVPDQVAQLHRMDIVDVLFKTMATTNFDARQSAVVLRIVCPKAGPNECRKKLYEDSGRSIYFMGETNLPVPDMSQYTFSRYYDGEGHKLPGVSLPQ